MSNCKSAFSPHSRFPPPVLDPFHPQVTSSIHRMNLPSRRVGMGTQMRAIRAFPLNWSHVVRVHRASYTILNPGCLQPNTQPQSLSPAHAKKGIQPSLAEANLGDGGLTRVAQSHHSQPGSINHTTTKFG